MMSEHPSVYRRHLGAAFDGLPLAVRRFHSLRGQYRLQGQVTVIGPEARVGQWLSAIFRFPTPGAELPFAFVLDATSEQERWQRHYPTRTMTSVLRNQGSWLVERLGPIQLWFHLEANDQRLSMQLRRITCLGVPVPNWCRPTIKAVETGDRNRLHFDVAAWLPATTLVVAYRGYVELPEGIKGEW